MSRRDTIVIAVLINAGLLVVLFSTALKSNRGDEIAVTAPYHETPISTPVTEMPIKPEVVVANSPQDEVDQLLRQFAPPSTSESGPVAMYTPEPNKSDFVQDLHAVTTPTPSAPVATAATEVTVKKGDVLEKIARTHHTTVDEIMRSNHLTTTRLKIGQVLKIQSTKKGVVPEAVDASHKYYTVKNGDNPWTIAVKNHMKVEELLKLNNLDADKARRLKPGDQLRIK